MGLCSIQQLGTNGILIIRFLFFNDVLTVKEEVISDDKFKVILLKIAEKFEITIDKRWKLEKLADAILATKEEVLTEDEK